MNMLLSVGSLNMLYTAMSLSAVRSLNMLSTAVIECSTFCQVIKYAVYCYVIECSTELNTIHIARSPRAFIL